MISIFLRTVFVYVFLSLSMRISGKRQVGQLQIGELVTALLLSELAAFPIADPDVPLAFAVLPIVLIIALEIFSACLCALFPKIKKIVEGTPSFLVAGGKLDQKALFKNRLSPDELMAQLRLKGVADLSDVDYAILEQNGQLSVILKSSRQPLTPEDLDVKPKAKGLARTLIVCGKINTSNMKRLNLSKSNLLSRLGGKSISDVLLYTVNDGGTDKLIFRDKKY